jgi:hypothetical protein
MIVKINIQLEYNFNVSTFEDAVIEAENVELPSNYVENSFEIAEINNEPFDVAFLKATSK